MIAVIHFMLLCTAFCLVHFANTATAILFLKIVGSMLQDGGSFTKYWKLFSHMAYTFMVYT